MLDSIKFQFRLVLLTWYWIVKVNVVEGVYVDQVGVNDWHLQHIGTPLEVIHSASSTLVHVRTDQNYVAALDSSNGTLAWRRSPNSQEVTRKIRVEQDMVWTVSQLESRMQLRFFDANQGGLLWEHRLKTPAVVPTVPTCCSKNTYASEVQLVWLSSTEYVTLNQFKMITLSKIGTSKPVWVWEPESAQEIVTSIHRELNRIYGFGVLSLTSQVFVYVIDETNGKVLDFKLFEDFTNEAFQFQILKGDVPYVIWAKVQCGNNQPGNNQTGNNQPGNNQTSNLEAVVTLALNKNLSTEAPIQHAIDSQNNPIPFTEFRLITFNGPEFYLTYSHFELTSTITFVIENNQIKPTGFHQTQEKILDFTEQNGQLVYLSLPEDSVSKPNNELGGINLIYPQNQNDGKSYHLSLDPRTYGKILSGFLHSDNQTVKLTLLTYDGSVHYAKGNKELSVVWYREESLAKASQSVMMELNDGHLWTQAEIELTQSGLVERYLHRLSSNFNSLLQLKLQLKFSQQQSHQIVPVDSIPTRDRLGLRKWIVIATLSGKLLALDSLNRGTVVWSRCVACSQYEAILQLVPLRSSDIKSPPVLGVVVKDKQNQVKLLRINGNSGLDLTSSLEPSQVWNSVEQLQQIVTLPLVDPVEGTSVLAFINKNNQVDLIPFSLEILSALKKLPQSIHSLYSKNNSLSGFIIEPGNPGNPGNPNTVSANPVWHTDFRNGPIFGLALSSSCQVASKGRILKDRRVLYNYFNPNLAAFATFNVNQLTIHLIDVISGSILYEAAHPTTIPESFHAIVSDNKVVYQYWDPYLSKAFVSVILELFEDSQPDTRHPIRNPSSSFTSHIPYVASRAYVSDNPVSALAVTQTRNGITNRDFLFAARTANHILAVPGHYLDALRPYDKVPNQVDAEGTVPYHPVLVFQPKSVLSYDLDVSGIKHLVSSPVTYESTTLVLGYGLDVFVTSYAPSQQFDVLQPDFSKSALLATVLALIIGITISGPMLQQKKLNEQWA